MATALASGQSSVLASYQGMMGSALLTVTEPPLVSLSSVAFVANKRHLVNQIRLTFSDAVNSAAAQNTGIYRLATPGKKGSFTAKNAGSIRLRTAVYDALHNAVILTPVKAFAQSQTIQLTVNGTASGLRDSFGRLIDGDRNGKTGGNAVAVFRKGTVIMSTQSLA
jgi:hypothetical protein